MTSPPHGREPNDDASSEPGTANGAAPDSGTGPGSDPWHDDSAGKQDDETDRPRTITPPPIRLRTITVVSWGMVIWLLALVVVLVVPDLRSGDRSWWVWVPVAALGLGGIGLLYLSRGRGNAAGS